MSNTYFRFRQFIIHQERTAMKVCTDSCLFGAWAADYLSHQKNKINILDIGAGTGLLSLMLAQKINDVKIDAVEIESGSAQQAKENIQQSHWKENIRIYQQRIQDFISDKQYDLIISNPPFYKDDLRSANETKNIAHHNTGLTLEELITTVSRFLASDGCFAVLLPYRRTDELERLANEGSLFLNKKTWVNQTPAHSYFRSMCMFSKENMNVVEDEIAIKDEQNKYTTSFIHLLKDYYLCL